ncbi:hypothetical protein [Mucilaginibacter dorajii]|uniref:Uncharacterized protein n=1 Tax=Mucilaginibacter dorajii TaxID=692994 RepID=A0ABP7QTV2_9SPHI|nr:hypothetical protein [Mucilaginibacter dorajii]MCS3734015.1 TRAP-type C4-dicarboxylate transport system substrate-binding protein [Mucilaginibacter dorajii]
MELKTELAFEDILHAVQHLPENQRAILKEELTKTAVASSKKKKTDDDNLTDFQKMLLNAPVMTAEEYENFKEVRTRLNNWTTK